MTTASTSPFDAALAALLAQRDAYKVVAEQFNAGTTDRRALLDAYETYFLAMNVAIAASPDAQVVMAYSMAVTSACNSQARLTREVARSGPPAAAESDRREVTERMKKWAATEKLYVELGFRSISDVDARAAAINPIADVPRAPVPVWDKLFIKRDEGEMAVMHGQAALETWQQIDESLVAAQVAIKEFVDYKSESGE